MKTAKHIAPAQPFVDEFGRGGHMKVVATIDYLRDYPNAEDGPFLVSNTIGPYVARQFHTYLDAMNEVFRRCGNDVVTVTFRSATLLICKGGND